MHGRMLWVSMLSQRLIIKLNSKFFKVYLRTSPAVAHERLVRRARPEETVVTLAYLQQLHRLHEEMVGQIQSADPTEKSDFHVRLFSLIEKDITKPSAGLRHRRGPIN